MGSPAASKATCLVEGCDQPTLAHGWCSRHYQRWRRTGDPIGGRGHDMTLEERFWSHVDKREPDECWPWTGATARGGYGTFMVPITGGGQQQVGAHQFAGMLGSGPPPTGMQILHSCDNPPCCNPGHLFLGTHTDNMRDKWAKGRVNQRRDAKGRFS